MVMFLLAGHLQVTKKERHPQWEICVCAPNGMQKKKQLKKCHIRQYSTYLQLFDQAHPLTNQT